MCGLIHTSKIASYAKRDALGIFLFDFCSIQYTHEPPLASNFKQTAFHATIIEIFTLEAGNENKLFVDRLTINRHLATDSELSCGFAAVQSCTLFAAL
jgi:hypothetical protein